MTRELFHYDRPATLESLETRRLLTTLSLDSSFGSLNGPVGVSLASLGSTSTGATAIAIQTDGKPVVAGYTEELVAGKQIRVIAVARFNTDGHLDDGNADITPDDVFGFGGYNTFAQSTVSQTPTAIAIQPDGKILVAAVASDGTKDYVVITRIDSEGFRDTTFGSKGFFTAFIGDNGRVRRMLLQPDGKIVFAGSVGTDWMIGRITSAGQFDTTFHQVGYRRIDSNIAVGGVVGLAIDNTNQYVIAGTIGNGANARTSIMRLTSAGDTDTTFGVNGVGTAPFFGTVDTTTDDLQRMPNGALLVIGVIRSNDGVNSTPYTGVRHSFDASGNWRESAALEDYDEHVAALSPTGGFTIVGQGATVDPARAHIKSYLADFGTSQFGPSPNYTPIYSGTLEGINDAIYAPDGKLYVVGYQIGNPFGSEFAVARYIDVDATRRGAVSGFVYNDANANGLQDRGETPLANVRVYVDVDDNKSYDSFSADGGLITRERSVLTDSTGHFTISGLIAGTYSVRQVTPSGYERTSAESFLVRVPAGRTVNAAAFGDRLVGSGAVTGAGFSSLVNGTLIVQGTGEADHIGMSFKKGLLALSVDGESQTILASLVIKIVIVGLGGNDTIGLGTTVTIPANIDGGAGNDTVAGSSASDTINGGLGDDSISGLLGDDRIAGGDGNDKLFGGDGRDRISGQDGDDSLSGDAGRDILSGGNGSDTVIGGASNDFLYGNGGDDILNGNNGNDYLDGGDGTDTAKNDVNDTTRIAVEVLV